jgi:hypothetical protein
MAILCAGADVSLVRRADGFVDLGMSTASPLISIRIATSISCV